MPTAISREERRYRNRILKRKEDHEARLMQGWVAATEAGVDFHNWDLGLVNGPPVLEK